MIEILQLKPKENSFYRMARNLTRRRLNTIFVCEGKRDTKVLKGIINKVFGVTETNLAITDCEGKDAVSEIAMYIATLALVSRTLRTVPIVIDADKYTPSERARSIFDSIRARIDDVELAEADKDIFEIRSQSLRIKIFVKVVGDFDLPYQTHSIDDHILRLLLLENRVKEEDIGRYNSAKEIVNEIIGSDNDKIKELILRARSENVQRAFENLIRYLKMVGV